MLFLAFSKYPSVAISDEKRRKAEEENDTLRAEKAAKRAETLERVRLRKEQLIAEQNANWVKIEQEKKTKELLDCFQNDNTPLVLTQKPKTNEERKESKLKVLFILLILFRPKYKCFPIIQSLILHFQF